MSPLQRATRNPMMLGLFLPIQSGGWSPSSLPRGTDWSFDYNAALTKRCEAIGFDLVFGQAQWLGAEGYGGATQYRAESLDAFIVAAGLAAVTERIICIFSMARCIPCTSLNSAPPSITWPKAVGASTW